MRGGRGRGGKGGGWKFKRLGLQQKERVYCKMVVEACSGS